LLEALHRVGRRAVGLEPEPRHPDIVATPIQEVVGEWASVVFWHSLEHLRDPRSALHCAANLLTPGGVLFVAIPNWGSLQARLFRDRWFALDLPRHLVHIPAKTLIDGVREEGLRIERISYVRGGQVAFGWLHGLVGTLPAGPDLYQAIRRPAARSQDMSRVRQAAVLGVSAILVIPAVLGAAFELLLRRGGTVYIEARRV
jgi:hypothetical protein